jgi:hypothetical protein
MWSRGASCDSGGAEISGKEQNLNVESQGLLRLGACKGLTEKRRILMWSRGAHFDLGPLACQLALSWLPNLALSTQHYPTILSAWRWLPIPRDRLPPTPKTA